MAVRVFLPRAATACAGKHALPAARSREDRRRTPGAAWRPTASRARLYLGASLGSPAWWLDESACLTARSRNTRTAFDAGVPTAGGLPSRWTDIVAAHWVGSRYRRRTPAADLWISHSSTSTARLRRGTYPDFSRSAVRPRRKILAAILLGPLVVAYRAGLVSDRAIRKAMSRIVFQGEQSSTCAVSANGTPPRRCPD